MPRGVRGRGLRGRIPEAGYGVGAPSRRTCHSGACRVVPGIDALHRFDPDLPQDGN